CGSPSWPRPRTRTICGNRSSRARISRNCPQTPRSSRNPARQDRAGRFSTAGGGPSPADESMSTKTQTTTTHYHIQKKRRAEFLEEWRNYRQSVIRQEDVTLVPTARGMRSGVYMGWDGDRPTRCLDALVHEVDPGTVTTIHRHSWDAILFMVSGSGWTEVD